MELMHYWDTKTCDSFTPRARDLLRYWIPPIAFQQEYLMESLLALTSLHLASERGCSNLAHVTALQYENRAIAGLRLALEDLTPNNWHAICVCSLFIMVCSMLSTVLPPDPGDEKWSPGTILPVVETLRGVATVLTMSKSWILRSPLAEIPQDDPIRTQCISTDLLLEQLRRLTDDTVVPAARRTLSDSIDLLDRMVWKRDVFPWLIEVKPEFLVQLQESNDLAVAITLQWALQLYRLSDMWWMTLFGRLLVERLSQSLETRGAEWNSIAGWSREQVSLHT